MNEEKNNKGKSEIAKKNDFVELKYTGYANGQVFDSNIEEDLKKIHPEAKAEPLLIIIGENMVVSGLDKAFEGKEIGKQYEITLSAKDAFGERRRELLKTLPIKIFHEQKIEPYPGLAVLMDGTIAKVISVSGARVVTDFNSPLAGKEIKYVFTILRKIKDEKEKCIILFNAAMRTVPEFEIEDKIKLKGSKSSEMRIKRLAPKFKELIGKELVFELKEEKKEDEKQT